MKPWPFDQVENCAVFTTTHVMKEGRDIVYVFHDEDDHGWQFHYAGEKDLADSMVVALKEIVAHDASVLEVADLPPGWRAWREKRGAPWRRGKYQHGLGNMSEAITGSALMRLSSSGTLWQKVILPAVWLTGFGLGALSTALGIGTPPLHLEQRIMFPVAWFLGLGLFAWRCFPLKQVWLAPEGVVVAGLRRKIAIPFSDIEAVRGSAVGSPVHIVLELKRPSAFGTRIRFMPTFRFMAFSPHPTFTMLSELVAAQRGEKIEAR